MPYTRVRRITCPVTPLCILCAVLMLLFAHASAAAGKASYDEIESAVRDGDDARAEELLRGRLASDANDVVALVMLGDIYRLRGEGAPALKTLQRAVNADPAYPETYLVLTKTYLPMRRFDDAARNFSLFKERMQPFVSVEPAATEHYLDALRYLSQEYLLAKEYDAFRETADEILRHDPEDQSTLYNLGVYYYYFAHDRARAYRSFETARALDPMSAVGKKARYAIEFIRANPDSRFAPDYSFLNQEFGE